MRDPKYYEILACPVCKTKVRLEDHFLVCSSCSRRYPIDEHGIPHMLIEEDDKHRPTKK